MKDEDIHAFGAPPVSPESAAPPGPGAAVPGAQRRRIWPWLLLGLSVLVLLLAMAGASALIGLLDGAREGWQVSVDGHPWSTLHGDNDMGFLGVLGITAAVLLLLVVLPVVLMLVLLAVALALGLTLISVVGTVVLALCAVLLVLALVLSPVWGSLLLLWLLLRKPRPRPGPALEPRTAQV